MKPRGAFVGKGSDTACDPGLTYRRVRSMIQSHLSNYSLYIPFFPGLQQLQFSKPPPSPKFLAFLVSSFQLHDYTQYFCLFCFWSVIAPMKNHALCIRKDMKEREHIVLPQICQTPFVNLSSNGILYSLSLF